MLMPAVRGQNFDVLSVMQQVIQQVIHLGIRHSRARACCGSKTYADATCIGMLEKMAIALRSPPRGCIFHSDRGSQYCSHDYQKVLREHGLKPSMSGKGNCYDNAAVETFFKTIKAELIWRRTWETRRKAETAIFQYINGFYNPRRRHSELGGKSPLAFERQVA
ncbi:MAG: putative transposase [Rhodobacteraceae bacterium HLUCCA08]|nr:MAG: putative transposase [Rhodobacteraceae bacterium HLUCCA08]